MDKENIKIHFIATTFIISVATFVYLIYITGGLIIPYILIPIMCVGVYILVFQAVKDWRDVFYK